MIFQDPAASLDPRQTVGKSIEEVFVINTDFPADVRREKTLPRYMTRIRSQKCLTTPRSWVMKK